MPLVRLLFGKFIASGRLMGLAGRLFSPIRPFSFPVPFSFQQQGFLARRLAFLEPMTLERRDGPDRPALERKTLWPPTTSP
jgi:hypothetical protein